MQNRKTIVSFILYTYWHSAIEFHHNFRFESNFSTIQIYTRHGKFGDLCKYFANAARILWT